MFNENSKGLFLTCMCNKVENFIRSSCHQKETVHRTLESLCQLTLVNEKQSLHCTSGIVRWLQNKGHPKFHYHVDSLKKKSSSHTIPTNNSTEFLLCPTGTATSMDSAGQWNVHLMTIGDTINNQTSYYSSSSDDGRTAGFATPTAMNYSLMETVLISAALLAIIVGTVVGNVLVCIAVCLVRRL